MRCSLFVPADTLPDRLRSRAYMPVEQQAVAAELVSLDEVSPGGCGSPSTFAA